MSLEIFIRVAAIVMMAYVIGAMDEKINQLNKKKKEVEENE